MNKYISYVTIALLIGFVEIAIFMGKVYKLVTQTMISGSQPNNNVWD